MIYVYVTGIIVVVAIILYQRLLLLEMQDSNKSLISTINESDEMFICIKGTIKEDREKFLKVDALGMTRDELAAFQKEAKESGGTAGAWPEDPCEAVKAILAEWHIMRGKMIDAEAKAAAAEWRSSQYESLQAINAEFSDIVAGVRDRLNTSPDSPFGVYTGRFPNFAKLALFLVDQALRAQAPPESLSKLSKEIV